MEAGKARGAWPGSRLSVTQQGREKGEKFHFIASHMVSLWSKRPQGAHHVRSLELAEAQGIGREAVSESQDVLRCRVGAILHLARDE